MTPYYEAAGIAIYHGDCRELLPELTADAIITDPPYGVGKKYGPSFNDRRPDYWQWLTEIITLMRAAAPLVAFTHRNAALKHLSGWDLIGVWNKPLATAGLSQLPVMPHWEPIFLYGVVGRMDLARRFDVFSANPAVVQEHPTPKPVELFRYLIDWLVPAGVVLDPFAGSGTTLRAAKDLGRKAIGIELEERWCEVAARRLGQEVLAL